MWWANTDNFGVTVMFFIFILVIFLLFTIFRLCMRRCWWSYHLPDSSYVNFSVNLALMWISIILSRLIQKCAGTIMTLVLSFSFSLFVLASLSVFLCLPLVLYLTTNINTIIVIFLEVHENDEKGYVRRFHSLKAMRRRELEGYLTWHCFYVHYNICLPFVFVFVFSICFFLFFGVPRNLLSIKNWTGNVEDLLLDFTVLNKDRGESQVIDWETVNKKVQPDSAFVVQ